jgi:hypothetical protein
VGGWKLLVEGQADGLDGDVGRPGLLEEGPQDARGDVAPAADGDYELWLEVVKDLRRGFLAEFVDLLGARGVLATIICKARCTRRGLSWSGGQDAQGQEGERRAWL